MTAATLWLEITIAGSIYLLALVCLCLRILSVHHVPTIDTDLLPYIAAGGVAGSYILGMLMHRLLQLAGRFIRQHVRKRDSASMPVAREHRDVPVISQDEAISRHAIIWQFGSDRLHRELDFQFALKSLFRSLRVSIPLLGVCLSWWLSITPARSGVPLVLLLASVLTALLIPTYREQTRNLERVRREALKVAQQASGLPRSGNYE